jgi:Ca2+-transporting ATPase
MGRDGTDVAKEAADLVITDDNLATIVAAIREGRGIYDNIRRVVEYLVAANISEVAIVVAALLFFPDLGTPLLPLQLLWINLITDGLPAVALGLDPVTETVMRRAPRRRQDSLLGGPRLRRLILRGGLLAATSLTALIVSRYAWAEPWTHARALMFTSIAFAQLAYAFAVRRAGEAAGEEGARRIFSNRWLTVAAILGSGLQIGVVMWEPARELLRTAILQPREWMLVAAAAILPSVIIVVANRPPRTDVRPSTKGAVRP